MEKPILKFIWNCKGAIIARVIAKNKNKVGELPFLYFENLDSERAWGLRKGTWH